jgi:hypothetical protein
LPKVPKEKSLKHHNRVYRAMKKCTKSQSLCKDPLVRTYFTLAPLTKYDYTIKDHLENLVKKLDDFLKANSTKYGNALHEFDDNLNKSNPKLAAQKSREKNHVTTKEDWDYHNKFSVFWYYKYDNPLNSIINVETNEKFLYETTKMDEKMGMPQEVTQS